jgi:hypothetical protein
MQIHELTRKQLNELDIAGAGGVLSKIGTAAKALVQPGGVKDALRTVTPGAGQGAFGSARNLLPGSTATGGTHDLTMSDFAKRMQDVKNSAAIKQVAANLQKQWNQTSKTLPAPTTTTTFAPGYSSVKTNAPPGIPSVGKSTLPTPTQAPQQTKTVPTTPASTSNTPGTYDKKTGAAILGGKKMTALSDLPPHIQKQLSGIKETLTQPITEAASLGQLTDWYKQSVIPKSMAAASAKYLAHPKIQTALKTIAATANNPAQQSEAFEDLVAATSVVSQDISAQAPAAAATGDAPAATKTLSGGAAAAKTEISRTAGISPTEIDAIAKLTSTLGRVQASDPNTIAYLQALGFKTA